jgi:hypothetical protein
MAPTSPRKSRVAASTLTRAVNYHGDLATQKLRIGVPLASGRLAATISEEDRPLLVSAGAFWRSRAGRFSDPCDHPFTDFALDSGGFTAQQRWRATGHQPGMLGRFPWTLEAYVELAAFSSPAFWSQPDLPVEPELGISATERRERIELTAALLHASLAHTVWMGAQGVRMLAPLPVLQGLDVDDYLRSYELMLDAFDRYSAFIAPPRLVGLGSVCRRNAAGDTAGVVAIVEAVTRYFPRGAAALHLFGVKSSVMSALAGHPFVHSFDSCAWDMQARRSAWREGVSNTRERRIQAMRAWAARQDAWLNPPQPRLL